MFKATFTWASAFWFSRGSVKGSLLKQNRSGTIVNLWHTCCFNFKRHSDSCQTGDQSWSSAKGIWVSICFRQCLVHPPLVNAQKLKKNAVFSLDTWGPKSGQTGNKITSIYNPGSEEAKCHLHNCGKPAESCRSHKHYIPLQFWVGSHKLNHILSYICRWAPGLSHLHCTGISSSFSHLTKHAKWQSPFSL